MMELRVTAGGDRVCRSFFSFIPWCHLEVSSSTSRSDYRVELERCPGRRTTGVLVACLALPLLYAGNVRERVLKLTSAEATNGKLIYNWDAPGSAAANRLQIATLIESLLRSVELLAVNIEHEETRAGVRDLSDPAYPVLARSLRARKDNIQATMASLEALVQASEAA
jgi:hypothetical protein